MLKMSVFKKKKVAPEKFLVVVNPWGLSQRGDFSTSDVNNIGAWFEFMLRADHPGVGIQAMYYQRTHRNIIVELPREVKDITNYLGRHYYSQFLTHSPLSEKYADIYEYKYSLHGDPGEKNWSIGYPSYKEIPPGIPLANPYPCPGTAGAPPIDVADYAYPIPPLVYERRIERLASELQTKAAAAATANAHHSAFSSIPDSSLSSGSVKNEAPSSSPLEKGKGKMIDPPSLPIIPESAFTQHYPPEHLTTKLRGPIIDRAEATSSIVKKMDPYEEDELAAQSLAFTQRDIKDEAEDFLFSLIGQPKEEEDEKPRLSPDVGEDDYEPSTELLAMFGTLPPGLDTDPIPHDDDPNDEFDVKVKPEPMEEAMPDYQPSEELLETLQGFLTSQPDDSQQAPYIKNEFQDSYINPPVKSEPMDDDRAFDFQSRDYRQGASRDPRARREEPCNVPVSKRRYSPTHYGISKRVKMEDDA
ncbi:hypothetical protein BJ912DRAFT_605061 [Pholiota molesta]|nr:hypothetical protein BJ912DRAFT_605061 [Pholiota molesta]